MCVTEREHPFTSTHCITLKHKPYIHHHGPQIQLPFCRISSVYGDCEMIRGGNLNFFKISVGRARNWSLYHKVAYGCQTVVVGQGRFTFKYLLSPYTDHAETYLHTNFFSIAMVCCLCDEYTYRTPELHLQVTCKFNHFTPCPAGKNLYSGI